MSHVSHRSTLPPPPDRVGRLTGTAALSVHATSIAGGTQRDPEGTSREPRRRCYGHRRGISLPKALYQNAARMSRGAEGTTEASGRRDQAGLAARKRRVGAVRGAVPAQNEPKSDRPRAKTPMNRRKSRLRRRAAPISLWRLAIACAISLMALESSDPAMGMSTHGGERRVCHGAPATSAPVDYASRTGWGRTVRPPCDGGHGPEAARNRCRSRAAWASGQGLAEAVVGRLVEPGVERGRPSACPTAKPAAARPTACRAMTCRPRPWDGQRVAPVVPPAGTVDRGDGAERRVGGHWSRLRGQSVSPPPTVSRVPAAPVVSFFGRRRCRWFGSGPSRSSPGRRRRPGSAALHRGTRSGCSRRSRFSPRTRGPPVRLPARVARPQGPDGDRLRWQYAAAGGDPPYNRPLT